MGNECCTEKEKTGGLKDGGANDRGSGHGLWGEARRGREGGGGGLYSQACEGDVSGTGVSRNTAADSAFMVQLGVKINNEKNQIISDRMLARKFKH